MVALKDAGILYAGKRYRKGDEFTARDSDVKVLTAVGLAEVAPVKVEPKAPAKKTVEASVHFSGTVEVEQMPKEAPAKRTYFRKVAESVEEVKPKRTYQRRDLTAE